MVLFYIKGLMKLEIFIEHIEFTSRLSSLLLVTFPSFSPPIRFRFFVFFFFLDFVILPYPKPTRNIQSLQTQNISSLSDFYSELKYHTNPWSNNYLKAMGLLCSLPFHGILKTQFLYHHLLSLLIRNKIRCSTKNLFYIIIFM